MKTKLLSLVLVLTFILSLAACNAPDKGDEKTVLTNAMDLTAEWNKVTAKDSLVQGCIVVRNDFLAAHPDAVEHFLDEYKASIDYLGTNPDEAAQLIVDAGIFNNAQVAKKALPKCNVRFVDGEALKTSMSTYLEILYGINPASVGGALPKDDFYYNRNTDVSPEKDGTEIRVFTLNGTTGFGMAKLMADKKAGTASENYAFTVKADAAEVTAALINGSADIAALPTNAAANVYNKTAGKVTVLAVNTLGCLYLLTSQNATVSSFADLKGKTVYVPAQNPTFIFKYLCEANGLTVGKDVILDSTSYAKPADLRDAVAAGKVDIAVLPEPMVTIAINAANAAAQK